MHATGEHSVRACTLPSEFPRLRNLASTEARDETVNQNFLISLNEIGRECEIDARSLAMQRLQNLCDAKITIVRSRLRHAAYFLCCVQLDAAMQKQKSRNFFAT